MPTFLKNMKIEFISLVKQGANKRTIIFKSSDKDPTLTVTIPIKKIDEENRRFYSIVYAPDDVDTQDEFTTSPEIQKAAYDFMKNLKLLNVDRSHNQEAEAAFVAESWLIKENDPIFPEDPPGSWAVGIVVEDETLWKDVKSGEINALSMGGTGERVKDQEIGKQFAEKENQIHYTIRSSGLFEDGSFRTISVRSSKAGISMVVGKLKGQSATTSQGLRFEKKSWSLADAQSWVKAHPEIKKADYPDSIDEDGLAQKIVKGLASILKIKDEGGDQDMKEKEVQEMIDKALEPVNKAIKELPKPLTKEEMVKVFGEAVKPWDERLKKIEKTSKGSAQDDDDIKKNEDLEKLGGEMAKAVNEG
jgi:hypothetical protein